MNSRRSQSKSLYFYSAGQLDLVMPGIDIILILGSLLCVQDPEQVGAGDAHLGLQPAIALPHLVSKFHSYLVAALSAAHQVTRDRRVYLLLAFQRPPDFEQLQNFSQHVRLDYQRQHSQPRIMGHQPTSILVLRALPFLLAFLLLQHVLQKLFQRVTILLHNHRR